MNADLMITIAFCIYVVLGSLVVVALAPRTSPADQENGVDGDRLDSGVKPHDAALSTHPNTLLRKKLRRNEVVAVWRLRARKTTL